MSSRRILCALFAIAAALAAAAPAAATFPGRNGRLVVELDGGSGEGNNLYLVRPDGSDPVRVSHGPGADLSASFSPLGDKLVFYRYRGGTVRGLFVVRVDGSGQHRIPGTGDGYYYPAFTPDPHTIAYSGGVYTMRLDGTHRHWLSFNPDDRRPVVSPDGRRIAFTHYNMADGHDQAFLMRSDGTHVRMLLDRGEPSSFSPDGRRLLLSRGGDIHVLGLKSGRLRRLTSNEFYDVRAVFSPNGHQIAFARAESLDTGDTSQVGVWMMRADGANKRRILDASTGSLDWQPLPR